MGPGQLRRGRMIDSVLHPDGLGVNTHRFLDDRQHILRTAEDINDLHGLMDI